MRAMIFVLLGLSGGFGCKAGTPAKTEPAPALPSPEATAAPAPSAIPEPSAAAPVEAREVEAAPPPPVEPVPVLVDEAGKTLPQTEELPSTESPSFRRRLELLVEAIKNDAPETALPAFFPVLAYAEVKAIAEPERDWQHRLVGAFSRNIHEYHKQLGADAGSVEFSGIEVPANNVKFMKPGSEGNRLAYHRVLRSRLLLKTPDAREVSLEVTSLISWRGEWYVVHLHGFK